ncbi:hypothetical protein J2X19_005062 [Rhodoferax ferrireducens]|uniref:Lipoprotein n=2 Tax=Rhodoferax ferrireducens TaxID=192843 RepID=A0ABU2CGB7_9BURK|nr:hypothetical protein [Rhodoferax ferrireducens]
MSPLPAPTARWTAALLPLGLCACGMLSPTPAPHGEARSSPPAPAELAQSDVNRMATLGMRDNLESLLRLADKLYKRNPAEWRKTSTASREDALAQVRSAMDRRQPWPALQGQRDIQALSLALSPDFKGDRVAAFILANADMLVAAHGDKTTFYLIDSLDAQHIYNAARNVEIAVWLLSSRRTAAGQPLLLADEVNERERNLSFEREFGKIVGRLDLLSAVLTEKYRRAAISYVQNLLGGSFLQFLPVR